MLLKPLKRVREALSAFWDTLTDEDQVELEMRQMPVQADLLRRLTDDCTSLDDLVEVVSAVNRFRPMQKKTEIVGLLQLIRELRPKTLLEIGSANGGTLFLLTRVSEPDAEIVSLDFYHTPAQLVVFPTFARAQQRLTCLKADSHSVEMLRKVKEWLAGRQLDFLFIDGDHSYEGVARDYEMYGPLVRKGGMIAFHDIVPDFRTRHGVTTSADAGGVPRFWEELRKRLPSTGQFIQHPKQDGYGIGFVRVNGPAAP